MLTRTFSAALIGVEAQPIEVEVELARGLPVVSIIGLGDAAVQEARYRIQAAVRAAGFEVPHRRVTINLAPAGLRKDGAALDVPMALALLAAAGLVDATVVAESLAVGELALSGALRPIRGALAVAALAKRHGFRRIVVPVENGAEARLVEGLEVVAAPSLGALCAHLRGELRLPEPSPAAPISSQVEHDLADVRGQALARRALEVAAAGRHNVFFVGPPGSGKTMLARRLPTILPPLAVEEQIEVTRIWSIAGLTLAGGGLLADPPFRAPHHTISEAGLVGGGSQVRPGEVSLAHLGVLFLDELPEMARRAVEGLRLPLEDRELVVTRAKATVRLPADFMLVAAANPCPCGWLGHPTRRCRCLPEQIQRYTQRVSGPVLDRIDLIVEVPGVEAGELLSGPPGETSAAVRARVEAARVQARSRAVRANRELSGANLDRATALEPSVGRWFLETAAHLGLSARALTRVRRVARTVADLRGEAQVGLEALTEALRYRAPASWSSR